MKLEYIIENIKAYIELETAGAILLNGPWGAGKTFFIKNILVNEINPKEAIHISLNGVNNSNELQGKIISCLTSISTIGNFAINLPYIKKFVPPSNLYLNSITKYLISKNISKIYIFDDLERTNSNNLKEILGYIQDQFIEDQNCKVILIANENEIENYSVFKKIKEKTVIQTIELSPQIIPFLDNYLNNSKNENLFLKTKKDLIISFVQYFQLTNIRTLQFYFFKITQLISYKIDSLETYLNDDKLKSFFFICFLYREGLITSMVDLDNLRSNYFGRFLIEDEVATKTEKIDQIISQYGSYSLINGLATALENYIFTGALLKDDLIKSISTNLQLNLKEEEVIEEQLSNIFILNDQEFRNLLAKFLRLLKKGVYEPYKYPRYYSRISIYKKLGLKLKGLELYLKKGIKNSFANHNPTSDQLEEKRPESHFEIRSEIILEEFQRLKASVIISEKKEIIKSYFKNPNSKKLKTLNEISKFDITQIFYTDTIDEIYSYIIENDNEGILSINAYFSERYLKYQNIGKYLSVEIPFLKKLLNNLKDYETKKIEDHMIRKYTVMLLIQNIENIIIHIEKTEK